MVLSWFEITKVLLIQTFTVLSCKSTSLSHLDLLSQSFNLKSSALVTQCSKELLTNETKDHPSSIYTLIVRGKVHWKLLVLTKFIHPLPTAVHSIGLQGKRTTSSNKQLNHYNVGSWPQRNRWNSKKAIYLTLGSKSQNCFWKDM